VSSMAIMTRHKHELPTVTRQQVQRCLPWQNGVCTGSSWPISRHGDQHSFLLLAKLANDTGAAGLTCFSKRHRLDVRHGIVTSSGRSQLDRTPFFVLHNLAIIPFPYSSFFSCCFRSVCRLQCIFLSSLPASMQHPRECSAYR
jgi:hypothetical protein